MGNLIIFFLFCFVLPGTRILQPEHWNHRDVEQHGHLRLDSHEPRWIQVYMDNSNM